MTDTDLVAALNRMTLEGAKVVLVHDAEMQEPWSCRWEFDDRDRDGKWNYVGQGTTLAVAIAHSLDEGEISRGLKKRPRRVRTRETRR